MSGIAIRRAAPEDAQALSLVASACFLETFAGMIDGAHLVAHCAGPNSVESYAGWLGQPDRYALFLAELNGAPVGFAMLSPPAEMPVADPQPDDLEIKRIYVLSRFHGAGVAKRLMEAAVIEAKSRAAGRVLLGVKDDNARAIAFYRKSGFTDAGTRTFTVGGGTYSDLMFAKAL